MKKVIFCFFFLIVNLLSVTVFADFDTAVFDRDTNEINVSGNAGADMAKQLISVVLRCNENVNDIKIVRTDENSDFECSFTVADTTALYEVLYQTPKSEAGASTSVNTYSSETIKEALNAFSSAETVEEMEIVFSEYTQILGFSKELLDEVSDYDALYRSVLKHSDGAETVKDAVNLVNETAIVQVLNAASAAQISELIEKYDLLIGASASELYKNYSAFEGNQINHFEEKMSTYTFAALDDIVDAFEICTILTEIQNAAYYTDTQLMIETYYEKLSIDMKTYRGLSENKKKDVLKTLTGYNAENDSKFREKWKSVTGGASASGSSPGNSNAGSSSSGRGGSGGGGSGGGVVSVETGNDVPVEVVSFVDIEDVSWARDAILRLANKGVINGKSEYRFYPNDDITRAEFVKILVGAFGFEAAASECKFDDVTTDDWAYPYVCTAVENEIVTGYSETEFGAEDNITRQDMVTMVMRALNKKKGTQINLKYELTFDDTAQIDDYALKNVEAAVYLGIVSGMGNNCFEPKAFATRAQAALLIYQSTEVDFN